MLHGRDQVRREGLVCFRRGWITNHRFIRGLCFQSAAAENMRSARWNRKHWVSGWLQPPFPAKYSEALLLINKWRKATARFQALKIYTCLFPTVLLLVQGIEELRSSGAEVSTLVQTQGRMTSLPGDEWQSLPLSFNSCAWVRGCVGVCVWLILHSREVMSRTLFIADIRHGLQLANQISRVCVIKHSDDCEDFKKEPAFQDCR